MCFSSKVRVRVAQCMFRECTAYSSSVETGILVEGVAHRFYIFRVTRSLDLNLAPCEQLYITHRLLFVQCKLVTGSNPTVPGWPA